MTALAPASSAQASSIVPGVSPQVYSQADFDRISDLVREEAGIVLGDGKRMLAYSRIAPLLRESSHSTFRDYLGALKNQPEMIKRTVSALTTNHTYFNRESHHFEHFAEHVRPDFLARASRGEPLRLWSAGSSSGEEIWTLMMVLLGEDKIVGKNIMSQDVIALASDLAEHVLEKASAGQYPLEAISAIPQKLRDNWTAVSGETATVNEDVRKLVRFRQLNLLREWPFSTQFDVIFCRNVMIYFDQPAKEHLVLQLARQLKPGGFLYIGHSERALGPALDLLEVAGPTIYQRKA